MDSYIPKTLYHGSGRKIQDGFVRIKPGHINNMQTPVNAVFATNYERARLYAVMRLIGDAHWKSPIGDHTLCVEQVEPNIPEKAYVYELDSDGFIRDSKTEYYSLTDKKIQNVIEINIMQEILKGNIRVFVLKDKIDFKHMPYQAAMDLWRETTHHLDKFEPYNPDATKSKKTIVQDVLEKSSDFGK